MHLIFKPLYNVKLGLIDKYNESRNFIHTLVHLSWQEHLTFLCFVPAALLTLVSICLSPFFHRTGACLDLASLSFF